MESEKWLVRRFEPRGMTQLVEYRISSHSIKPSVLTLS